MLCMLLLFLLAKNKTNLSLPMIASGNINDLGVSVHPPSPTSINVTTNSAYLGAFLCVL